MSYTCMDGNSLRRCRPTLAVQHRANARRVTPWRACSQICHVYTLSQLACLSDDCRVPCTGLHYGGSTFFFKIRYAVSLSCLVWSTLMGRTHPRFLERNGSISCLVSRSGINPFFCSTKNRMDWYGWCRFTPLVPLTIGPHVIRNVHVLLPQIGIKNFSTKFIHM